eukprot:3273358-Pleurochrysis_carterae.AAC.2
MPRVSFDVVAASCNGGVARGSCGGARRSSTAVDEARQQRGHSTEEVKNGLQMRLPSVMRASGIRVEEDKRRPSTRRGCRQFQHAQIARLSSMLEEVREMHQEWRSIVSLRSLIFRKVFSNTGTVPARILARITDTYVQSTRSDQVGAFCARARCGLLGIACRSLRCVLCARRAGGGDARALRAQLAGARVSRLRRDTRVDANE